MDPGNDIRHAMNYEILQHIVILLTCAVLAVVLFRRASLPPILAYLAVGVLIGPHGFEIIGDHAETRFLAEFGVVFLLFTVGLEFSLTQLMTMRGVVLGLGGAQVILSMLFFGGLAWVMGASTNGAIIIGGILALSSTAIVIKQLTEQLELNSRHGRHAVGILIFQDLAVIPLLIMIEMMTNNSQASLTSGIVIAMAKGAAAFIIMLAIGRWLLRPLFRVITKAHSTELFMLTVLLVSLSAAWGTHVAGLSLALGGFLAGVMLGETEFRHQVESDIRPFRDVLLGLFFVTIGMLMNVHAIADIWHWVIAAVIGMMLFKALLIFLLGIIGRMEAGVAMRTGMVLAQSGEFGFALLSLSTSGRLISEEFSQFVLATMLISMALSPLIIRHNGGLVKRLFARSYLKHRREHQEDIQQKTHDITDHIIICGYGRIGQNIAHFLEEEDFPYIALELDPNIIREARKAGEHVYYGDSTHRQILKSVGLARARVLVISYDDPTSALKILSEARILRPDIPILVRTRDDSYLDELTAMGATEVVPETLEASLMLASQLLFLLDVKPRTIVRYVRRVRANRYQMLRGFFHGDEHLELEAHESHREGLHTITIQKNSKALGKMLRDLHLDKHNVTISALRRDDIRNADPQPDLVLQDGDILVLHGAPEDMEHVETMIL